jgi:4-dimethylallyltryptophan N-methyltransferase
LDKVIILLEALEGQKKNVTYYASDLSVEPLASSLQEIPTKKFKQCRCAAIHGTFNDGLHWLKETPRIRELPHCILLLRLTIGNYSRENAAKFHCNIVDHALVGGAKLAEGS